MPKICLFTETYYPLVGGGETQARALAEGLAQRGHPVFIITRRSDAGLRRKEVIGGIPVFRLAPAGAQHLKKWGLLLSGFFKLFRLRDEYDLIFVSGYRVIGVAAVLCARLLGKRCILKADSPGEMSGAFFRSGLKRLGLKSSGSAFRFFLGLRNRVLRQADAFVAISTAIAGELREQQVAPVRIRSIPNSVDIRRFCPATPGEKVERRRRLGLPLEAKIVIYTGRLVTYKGLPLLLQVWKELSRDYPGYRLLIVGEGGLDIHSCENELHAYVERHRISERVIFSGPVENVADYLQASDLFVFPTEKEAFGISLIEAMACGLPVIATPVGGIVDIIRPEINGVLVDAGDAGQLTTAIRRLLLDESLCKRLAAAARQTVSECYAVTAVVGQYQELFEAIAQGHYNEKS